MSPTPSVAACKLMEESAILGLPFHYSICLSKLKYQMKNLCVLYEQLLGNVSTLSHMQQYDYVLSILNKSSIAFSSNLLSFSLQNYFKRFQFIIQLGLKFGLVCQVRTEVQFYKAVDTKFSLKFKSFSPDTEVIDQELVIEMLDEPVMPSQVR